MQPAIKDGQIVLLNCWAYLFRAPAIDDIAIFRNPRNKEQLICKRVCEIQNDRYLLRGDNRRDSMDSRDFGPVSYESIIGKVIQISRAVTGVRFVPRLHQ